MSISLNREAVIAFLNQYCNTLISLDSEIIRQFHLLNADQADEMAMPLAARLKAATIAFPLSGFKPLLDSINLSTNDSYILVNDLVFDFQGGNIKAHLALQPQADQSFKIIQEEWVPFRIPEPTLDAADWSVDPTPLPTIADPTDHSQDEIKLAAVEQIKTMMHRFFKAHIDNQIDVIESCLADQYFTNGFPREKQAYKHYFNRRIKALHLREVSFEPTLQSVDQAKLLFDFDPKPNDGRQTFGINDHDAIIEPIIYQEKGLTYYAMYGLVQSLNGDWQIRYEQSWPVDQSSPINKTIIAESGQVLEHQSMVWYRHINA